VSEEKVVSLGNNLSNINRRLSKKIGQGTVKKENVWQKYVITLVPYGVSSMSTRNWFHHLFYPFNNPSNSNN
jgi:hypothetical protein